MPALLSFPKLVQDVKTLIENVKKNELSEKRKTQIQELEALLRLLKTGKPVSNRELKEEYAQTLLEQETELVKLRSTMPDLYMKTFKPENEEEQQQVESDIENQEATIKELEHKHIALNKLYCQDEILNERPVPYGFNYRKISDEKSSAALIEALQKIKEEIELEFSGVMNAMVGIFVENTPETDKLYAGIKTIFAENELEKADQNQIKREASSYHQLFTRIEGVKNPAPLKKTEPRPLNIAEKAARKPKVDLGVIREAKPGEYENMPKAWKTVSDRPFHYGPFHLPLNKVRQNLNPVDTDERHDCVVDEECDSKSKPILRK